MSLTQRVKQGFLRLPLMKKAILLASAGLMVSTVMPWYDHRNSFGIGDTYLGIQGPLFIVGALVLACGAVTFFNMLFPLMGRNFFSLKKRGGTMSLVLGAQALLLTLIANVIFYHPEFSNTVSTKATRFGMVVAFASIGVMILAGYLVRRKEGSEEDDVEDILSEATPVTPAYSTPVTPSPTPNYSVPVSSTPAASVSRPAYSGGSSVDPLTLDPRTRYKMMRSQTRYSQNAQSNLWGGGTGSAFSRANRVESDSDSDY